MLKMKIEELIKNPGLLSIDTRAMKKGEVFVAIKGKNFDGHDFVKDAFRKGAKAAVVSGTPDISAADKNRLIRVKDTVKALGDIAAAYRSGFNIPVVAVTGSNGKTTVKDMIAHVLSSRYSVLKNDTSKNNLIGLPLTLFNLKKGHEVAVLEMGMNRLGEIGRLGRIAKSHIGVITNIGPSHLQFLGTLKNIFAAKTEFLKELGPGDAVVLNRDDAFLRNIKNIKCKKIYFGIEKKCHFQAKKLLYNGKHWSFSVNGKGKFALPLLGRHNVYNALAAIAVGRQFNIDFAAISKKISSYKHVSRMRLELKNVRGVEILDDSYNSNPLSMKCAINTLLEYKTGGKRIVIAGDMLELGKKARKMHEAIGDRIAASPIDVLITMGGLCRAAGKKAKKNSMKNIYHAKSHRDAADLLRQTARPGDVVLIKGSRGMEMEKIIEEFKKI